MWVESQNKRGRLARFMLTLNASVLFLILYLNTGAVDESYLKEDAYVDAQVPIETVRARKSNPPTVKQSAEFDGINSKRLKLSEGKWLAYFPHITRMVKSIEEQKRFPSWAQTTSPYHTTLTLKSKHVGFVGDSVTARIQARDYMNNPKRYGGDYFRVSLNRFESGDDGVTCGVVDHSDGTYTTRCPLLWQGNATLQVTLVNPSELVYLVIVNTNKKSEPGLIMNATFQNSHGEIEYGICDVDLSDRFRKSEICDHSHQKTGEPWFCTKPPSGECNPVMKQMHRIITRQAVKKIGDSYFKHCEKDCNKSIKNQGIKVEIKQKKKYKKSLKQNVKKLPSCNAVSSGAKVPLDPSEATGYMFDENWKTFHCNNSHGLESSFAECLSNHSLYIMGDSTVLAWFRSMVNSFRVHLRQDLDWAAKRDIEVDRYNVDIHYSSHGPPFHGEGPPSSRRYIVDGLDEIQTSTRPTVVMFGIGVHFGRLHPNLFLRRVKSIKEAVQKLRKRLSDVRVFVLGHHSNRPWLFQISPWVAYRHEVILRNELGNVRGVTYLPLWDMLEKMGSTEPHPFGRYLKQEQSLFLSHVCDAHV